MGNKKPSLKLIQDDKDTLFDEITVETKTEK